MFTPILHKPYTPAVSTDIRATFQLERQRLAALQRAGQDEPSFATFQNHPATDSTHAPILSASQ